MVFSAGAALLWCAALVTAVSAQTRPPAPGTRPAAPATRPAGSTRPGRPYSGDPAPPPPPPPPEDEPRAPATAPGGGWYAAANLRLDALQAASSEVPLDPAARIRMTDRIARARAEVNAAASRGETPAGKQAADAALARLDADVQAAARDVGPRLATRAGQIFEEVRELGRANTSAFATMFDVLTRPSAEQQAKIRQILSDAGRRVEQIELGPRDGLEQRRYAAGFATRAALRGVLTPEQLKNWDELSAPRAGGGIAATSRPAAPNYAAEIEANYYTRLAAMRLAAEEGPYKPDARAKARERVQKLKEDIAAAAAEPVKPRGELTADKVDRLRVQCARDLNDILGGLGAKDFDERVQRIVSQVLMLHSPDRPLTSAFLSDTTADLGLTPEQKAKIDQLLIDRVEKLKQTDKEAAGQPAPIQRMRREEVAFATRAAIRQTLTPKQLKVWDQ